MIASISAKFRTQLDLDSVLRVAVEETGRALGVSRSFIRLGAVGERATVEAEWMRPGMTPIGDLARELPGANLAARERRTVVVSDVRAEQAFEDVTLGSVDVLDQIQTRAVLATPIVVFDQMIGVFALHNPEPTDWTPAAVGVAEAVAREVGLAVRIARLLSENDERLRQQTGLLRAAQQVTAELELDAVLQRLADEVAALVGAESADLYLHDPDRRILRCAAVHGLPEDLIGFELPSDRGVAADAMRSGAPVISGDYGTLADRIPHAAYEGFTDAIVAPIVWGGETRGVLGVGRANDRRFTARDADVIGAFATLAALALRNAETLRRAHAPGEGAARLLPDRKRVGPTALSLRDARCRRASCGRGSRRRLRGGADAAPRSGARARRRLRASGVTPVGARRGFAGVGRCARALRRRAAGDRGRLACGRRPVRLGVEGACAGCGLRRAARGAARDSAW